MPLDLSPPVAPSALARYRILSPRCGLRVSPIQLGAMNIGEAWSEAGMGAMNKESSFKLLDRFYELCVFHFSFWTN
jgi:aryl-alcohol dehydrogenase-like predicted oxidoreductase